MSLSCESNIKNTVIALASNFFSENDYGMTIMQPNQEGRNIIQINGLNKEKADAFMRFYNHLDPKLKNGTSASDWINGDYFVFPEIKIIEAISNSDDYVDDSQLARSLRQNLFIYFLNDETIYRLLNEIQSNGIDIPTNFLSYNSYVLNTLIVELNNVKRRSDKMLPKKEILSIIEEKIKFYQSKLEEIRDGNKSWLEVLTEEVSFLEHEIDNYTKNKDLYGKYSFRLSQMYRSLNDIQDEINDINDEQYTKIASLITRIRKISDNAESNNKLKESLMNDIAKELELNINNNRIKDEKAPLSSNEKIQLGKSIEIWFSDKKDMPLLNKFFGIESGLKSTNEELGEYIINEISTLKTNFLSPVSEIFSKIETYVKLLQDKKEIKKLFLTWVDNGITYHEQVLTSPYQQEIYKIKDKLKKLRIDITTGYEVEANTKLYHSLVSKYFDKVINIENLNEYKSYIIKTFGKYEYEKIKKQLEQNQLDYDNVNKDLYDETLTLKTEILNSNSSILKGAEVQSLYHFEILLPKEEYINKDFMSILNNEYLYEIWNLVEDLLLNYYNPIIFKYDKNYAQYNKSKIMAERRIPAIKDLVNVQIDDFAENRSYSIRATSFWRKYFMVYKTKGQELNLIKERLKKNKVKSAYYDDYFNEYIVLSKKYESLSLNELIDIATKNNILNLEEANEDLLEKEYLVDALTKAEIASTHTYDIVDILNSINKPLADVYAGHTLKHRLKFIINLFSNKNKRDVLDNLYNRTVLGEKGYVGFESKKLRTFKSKEFKKWVEEQETLIDLSKNDKSKLDELEFHYITTFQGELSYSYYHFKFKEPSSPIYTAIQEGSKLIYYKDDIEISEDEYNLKAKEYIREEVTDPEASYLTFATIINQFMLVKVIKDLGLSIRAMKNNRRAGRLANDQTGANGFYYNTEELNYARAFLWGSMFSQGVSTILKKGNKDKLKLFSKTKREKLLLFESFLRYYGLLMQKSMYDVDESGSPVSFLLNFAIDIPEYMNQGELLLAMLSRLEYVKHNEDGSVVKDENGNEIKFKFFNGKKQEFEIFEFDESGKLSLKKGFEYLHSEFFVANPESKFKQKLLEYRKVNHLNNGNYSEDDTPYFFSRALGRFILNYMRWVPEGINRSYKGFFNPKDIEGRKNWITDKIEPIGVMTYLAKHPISNMAFHFITGILSAGTMGITLLTLGFSPIAGVAAILIASQCKALASNYTVNRSLFKKSLSDLEKESEVTKNEITKAVEMIGNGMIRLMADMLPTNLPTVTKAKAKISKNANFKSSYEKRLNEIERLMEDASVEKRVELALEAENIRSDMAMLRQSSFVLSSEVNKFIMIQLLLSVGFTILSSVFGGGDDDDELSKNISHETPYSEIDKEINKIERKNAIAQGIINKLVNNYTSGYEINDFATSFSSALKPFTADGNPSIRNVNMIYINSLNLIKMWNGTLGYTPARLEKSIINSTFFAPIPNVITHSIIDIALSLEKNNLGFEDRTIDVIMNKRTIFTDTKIYEQGLTILDIFDKNRLNTLYKKKWDVLFQEANSIILKSYLKANYKNRTLTHEEKVEIEDALKSIVSNKKSIISSQYKTLDFDMNRDYIKMYKEQKEVIDFAIERAKEDGDFSFFASE